MLRNINLRSPIIGDLIKGSLLKFRTLLFKTLQSPFIMPKLTIPERTFIVEKYFETKSVVAVLRQFQIAFPGRNPPSSSSVWRNVNQCRLYGTSLNRNKGNSGRRKTGRSEENIQAVREQLMNNLHVSARRNDLGLPSATFNTESTE